MRMRIKTRLQVALGTVLLTTACVPSLYPLYTEEDVVFEPAAVGAWIDGDDTWTFEKAGTGYTLTIIEDGVSADFDAHIVQLGEHRFVDLFPEDEPLPDHDIYNSHIVPVHHFWKFSLEGDTMRLVGLDHEWLEDQLESGSVSLSHSRWGDNNDCILLTAQTPELQAFMVAHAGNPEAFPEGGPDDGVIELQRQVGEGGYPSN